MNREVEDGMGFSGLVPTREEREIDRLRAKLAKYEAAGKGLLPDCEPVAGAGVCAAFQFARAALGKVGAEIAAKDARIAELEAANHGGIDIIYIWRTRAERAEAHIKELNDKWADDVLRVERAEAELDISREAHRMVQSALLSQAAETERAEAELKEWMCCAEQRRQDRDKAEAELKAMRELLEMLQSAQWLKPAQRKAIRDALAPSLAERDCGCEDASKCWGGSPGIKCRRPFPSPAGRIVTHEEGARMIQEPEPDDGVIVHEDGSISSPAGREG